MRKSFIMFFSLLLYYFIFYFLFWHSSFVYTNYTKIVLGPARLNYNKLINEQSWYWSFCAVRDIIVSINSKHGNNDFSCLI